MLIDEPNKKTALGCMACLAGCLVITGWVILNEVTKTECEKARDEELSLMQKVRNSTGSTRRAYEGQLSIHQLRIATRNICPDE